MKHNSFTFKHNAVDKIKKFTRMYQIFTEVRKIRAKEINKQKIIGCHEAIQKKVKNLLFENRNLIKMGKFNVWLT